MLGNCWSITDGIGDWPVAGFKFVNLCIFFRYRSYLPTCGSGVHATKKVVTGKKKKKSNQGWLRLSKPVTVRKCFFLLLISFFYLGERKNEKYNYIFHSTLQSYNSDVWSLIFTWDRMTVFGLDSHLWRDIAFNWEALCRGVDGKGTWAL